MDKQNSALYTIFGLTFVTLGLTLFDDEKTLQYGFMGAGILMLLFSALKGLRSTGEKQE